MPKTVTANGKTFTFNDNVSNEDISNAIDEYFTSNKDPEKKNSVGTSKNQNLDLGTSTGSSDIQNSKIKTFTGFSDSQLVNLKNQKQPTGVKQTIEQLNPVITRERNLKKELSTTKVTSENQNDISAKTDELSNIQHARTQQLADIDNKIVNSINSIDPNIVQQKLADEENTNQISDYLTEGAKKVAGSIVNPLYRAITQWSPTKEGEKQPELIDTTTKTPYQDEINDVKKLDINNELSPDELLSKAKELKTQKIISEQKALKAESILSDLDPIVQERIKAKQIQSIDNLDKIQKGNLVQINLVQSQYNDLMQSIMNDKKTIDSNIDTSDEFKANYAQKLDKFNALKDNYISLVNDQNKIKNDKLSAEENVKLFSMNYQPLDNFAGKTLSGFQGIVGGGLHLLGSFDESLGEAFGDNSKSIFKKAGDKVSKLEEDNNSKFRHISLSDIADSPEPISEFGRYVGQTVAGFIPYTTLGIENEVAQNIAKSAIVGGSAGNKNAQMEKETKLDPNVNYSKAQMFFAPLGYAGADYLMVGNYADILKGSSKAIESIVKTPYAREQFDTGIKAFWNDAISGVKSSTKTMNHSGMMMAGVEATKMFTDEMVLNKRIDDKGSKLLATYIDGAVMDGILQVAPKIGGYVLNKLSPNSGILDVRNNVTKISEYTNQLTNPNLTPEAKKVAEDRIKDLSTENENIIKKSVKRVNDFAPIQIQTILDIEGKKSDIREQVIEIKRKDNTLPDNLKKDALNALKIKFTELESKKQDIFTNKHNSLSLVSDSEQNRLMKQAENELNPNGEKSSKITDSEIKDRAVKIYKNEIKEKQIADAENQAKVTEQNQSQPQTEVQKANQEVSELNTTDKFKKSLDLFHEINSEQEKYDNGNGKVRLGDNSENSQRNSNELQSTNDSRKSEASDEVKHALDQIDKGVLLWSGDIGQPRIDLGIEWRDIHKGEADLKKGKYDSVSAKRLIEAFNKAKEEGGYHYKLGTGGKNARSREFVSLTDIEKLNNEYGLTDAEQKEIIEHEDKLAKDFTDYFNSLDEETKTEIRENHGEPNNSKQELDRESFSKGESDNNGENKQGEKSKNGKFANEQNSKSGDSAFGQEKQSSVRLNEDLGVKARDLAKQLREGNKNILPDWLIAEGAKGANSSGISLNEAFAKALETFADVHDATKDFAKSVEEAFKHIKDWYDENGIKFDEEKTKEGLSNYVNSELPKKEIGTKKELNDALYDELGLKPIDIQKGLTKDEGFLRGKELVDSGQNNPIETIDYVLNNIDSPNSIKISPDNEFSMIYFEQQLSNQRDELHLLKQKLDLSKEEDIQENATLSQKLAINYDLEERRLNASQLMGNVGSKYFRARQISVDEKGFIVNKINKIKNFYGDKIPTDVSNQLKDLQLKYDELVAKNKLIESKFSKLEVEKEARELARKNRGLFGSKISKKTSEQFAEERKQIIDNMKKDLFKASHNLYSTIPLAPQLTAITPHVMKLLASLSDEGITKLDDIVLKTHDILKDIIDGISKEDVIDIIAGKYKEPTKRITKDELQKQLQELKTQSSIKARIQDLENGIVREVKVRGEQSESVKELQKQLQEVKKHSLNEYADLSIQELQKQVKTTQTKIDKGEYFKTPFIKRKFENDANWIKNNQELTNIKKKLKNLEFEAAQSEKSSYMRGLDFINRWDRRVIFFGSNAVYTKLSSAALLGSFVHRPIEQTLGKINSKLFPNIAKNAPIEGYINMQSEVKFYNEFLNPKKLINNWWDIAVKGETELSKELSKYDVENLNKKYINKQIDSKKTIIGKILSVPIGALKADHIPIIDLFAADAHIMIKDPVKRATFESAMINYLKYFDTQRIDYTHPLIMESARQSAYKIAEIEIFQQSAKNGNKVSEYFNELSKKGIINNSKDSKWDNLKGNIQYSMASLYNFFIPINTVPLNIMKRVFAGNPISLTIKTAEVISKNKEIKDGISNLTTEESDILLNQLKKGQVGLAYWTLGFMLGGSVLSGLYTNYTGNTKHKPKPNKMKLGNIDVPKDVQHNSQLQSMQVGATYSIVYNHFNKGKKYSRAESTLVALAATGGVILDQIPVVKTGVEMVEATQNSSSGKKIVKNFKRRISVEKASDVFKVMGYEKKSKK